MKNQRQTKSTPKCKHNIANIIPIHTVFFASTSPPPYLQRVRTSASYVRFSSNTQQSTTCGYTQQSTTFGCKVSKRREGGGKYLYVKQEKRQKLQFTSIRKTRHCFAIFVSGVFPQVSLRQYPGNNSIHLSSHFPAPKEFLDDD